MSTFVRLTDYKSQTEKENEFFQHQNYFVVDQNVFNDIAGSPFAYWLSEKSFASFKNHLLSDYVIASVGIQTGDNEKFIRCWWEVPDNNILYNALSVKDSFQEKDWFPYNKGGEYRKWSGNSTYIVKWKNDGSEIKKYCGETGHHYQQYADELKFQPLITWSRITTGTPAFRYRDSGYLSDMAGFCLYSRNINLKYAIAFCNSKVACNFLNVLAPTLNIMTGQVLSLPIVMKQEDEIVDLADKSIEIVGDDWNDFEVSWEFKRHPLI